MRVLFAGVFTGSGIAKLATLREFAVIVDAYGLIPNALSGWAALGLASLELAAGIGLLVDLRGSLAVVTAMMVLFILVLSYGIHLGLDVDCGCFGPGDPEGEAFHGLRAALVRDLAMMIGIVYLYGWRRLRGAAPLGWKRLCSRGLHRKEVRG